VIGVVGNPRFSPSPLPKNFVSVSGDVGFRKINSKPNYDLFCALFRIVVYVVVDAKIEALARICLTVEKQIKRPKYVRFAGVISSDKNR